MPFHGRIRPAVHVVPLLGVEMTRLSLHDHAQVAVLQAHRRQRPHGRVEVGADGGFEPAEAFEDDGGEEVVLVQEVAVDGAA